MFNVKVGADDISAVLKPVGDVMSSPRRGASSAYDQSPGAAVTHGTLLSSAGRRHCGAVLEKRGPPANPEPGLLGVTRQRVGLPLQIFD